MSPGGSRGRTLWALALLLVTTTGCHRVILDSGLEPANQVYHEEWNLAFAYAIFPAQVDASQWCGGRFSEVETKQSFLNGVVSALTSGIIAPMDVRVVCAGGGTGRGTGSADDAARRSGPGR